MGPRISILLSHAWASAFRSTRTFHGCTCTLFTRAVLSTAHGCSARRSSSRLLQSLHAFQNQPLHALPNNLHKWSSRIGRPLLHSLLARGLLLLLRKHHHSVAQHAGLTRWSWHAVPRLAFGSAMAALVMLRVPLVSFTTLARADTTRSHYIRTLDVVSN